MSNEENLNEIEAKENASTEPTETAEPVARAEEAVTLETQAENSQDRTAEDDSAQEDKPSEPSEKAQAQESETNSEQPKEQADKPVKVKEKKASGKKGGMSKTFKLVYYPIVAVFALLMLVFSIVDGVYGYSAKAFGDDYYTAVNTHIETLSAYSRSAMSPSNDSTGTIGVVSARKYITDTLVAGGFKSVEEKKPEVTGNDKLVTVTDWAKTAAGTLEPTVTLHTAVPSSELQAKMEADKMLAGYELTNIVAAIPSGKADAGAVVITVRYDSRPDTKGAADNAAFVANAMQALIEYVKNGVSFENDVVVVFTEDLDCSIGAYTFFDTFNGLNDVKSRAKYGVSLDAYGNAGTLALVDASNAGYDYISAYTKVSGSAFNSSIVPDSLDKNLVNKYAVKAFGDVPSVQVAVVGGLDSAQSPFDTAENISQAIVYQQADFFKSYVDYFANNKTAMTAEGNANNVFFSYFDAGSVVYTDVASYVIGALLLALIIAAVAVMVVKKTFSVMNMIKALVAELLVVLGALAAMFAAYFLVTLMLTGFGVLPIHSIITITHFNAGILIAAMLVSLAAAFGFTILVRKLFAVTPADMVRGTALLLGVVGMIMSFACPAYSFMTSWLGMLSMIVMLVTVLTQKAFKDKFGFGMGRLYLYTLPVILCMPIVVAQIPMLMQLLPLVLLPVIMTVFTAMLGTAVPYLERVQKPLDMLAKKLPMRTQRVERTVTEKVEDKVKKGRYTEMTFKRVEKEKVPVNYKNYFGISVVAVLGIVIALFSGGFGVTVGKTLTGYQSYDNAVYNDAFVYEWGTDDAKLVIDDLMLYKYARYSISGLEWDGNRYVKSAKTITITEPTITKTDETYNVNLYEPSLSTVTLTIPSARAITKITVKETSKDGNADYEGFVYEFDNQSTITLRLPYGFGNFTMTFDGGKPTTIQFEEKFTVTVSSTSVLDTVDDWNRLKSDLDGTDVFDKLRGAIVLKRTFNV